MIAMNNSQRNISIGLVAAGEDCCDIFLDLLDIPNIDITGIFDTGSDGSCAELARQYDILVVNSAMDILETDPDVIINMSEDDEIESSILKYKSSRSEVIGKNGINVFMGLIGKYRQSEKDIKNLLTDTSELYNLGVLLIAADTLEMALDIILKEALRILKAPAGSIALYDGKTNSLVLKAYDGFPDDFSSVTQWEKRRGGMTDHILGKRVPTVINDVRDFPFVDNEVLLAAGIKSLVALPFRANSRIVGILYIDDFEPRQWKPREVDFLILFGVQAASAIEKFKLIEDIRDTKTYLQNVLDNSADMIITADSEGKIVEFNKGATRILGYSNEEIVGTNVESLWIKPEERQQILNVMEVYNYVPNHETRFKTKRDDVVDVSLTLSYIHTDGSRVGTVGIAKDITEKKRLARELEERHRELKELNERLEEKVIIRTKELREANRELRKLNEAKSKFIATMSHELRTPLNSILGFSEILKDEGYVLPSDKQKRYATNIYNSGSHLLQLINNILDLAKIESGKTEVNYESLAVKKVISEVEAVIRPLTDKKKQKLEVRIAENVSFIRADKIKFKQILYNLLSNAVKFTPEEGGILLEGKIAEEPCGRHTSATGCSGEMGGLLVLSVADTGIGVKKEDIERIFVEFEQVDSSYARRYEGTGLGLALTRKLVELHGGEVRVESEEGRGSKFIVVLPLTDKATEVDAPHHLGEVDRYLLEVDAFKGRRASGPLILVVEDDRPTSELMTFYLVQGGYRVAHAYSGDGVIDRIYELRPFAVILDIMLPGKDGWEILQEIKSDPGLKDIPVIISSIIDNNELGFALGASDYLVKPIDRNSLFEKLNELSLSKKKRRRPVTILCIDDNDDPLELLRVILEPEGYTVITANSGKEGIGKAMMHRPDLVILDLMMPDLDGFEVARILKENPATMDIPIFVLTAKDITVEERFRLAGKISKCMQKSYFTKEDLLMHIRDLEAMYPVRAGLLDEVSGLLDHSYFQIRLGQEVSRAIRYKSTFTLVLVDLDDFTEYIKANGLRQANMCVRKIAEFLKKSTRGSDVVVRYGIDEFAIILANTVKEMTGVVASRILSYIDHYPFFGEELVPKGRLSASIAIVNCPQDAAGPEEIMAKAHKLMRKAKESGGNRIQAYEYQTEA